MKLNVTMANEKEIAVHVTIAEDFEFDIQLARFRSLPVRRFDRELRAWVVSNDMDTVRRIIELFKHSDLDWSPELLDLFPSLFSNVRPNAVQLPVDRKKLLQELKLQGYSFQTNRTYRSHIERFLRFCSSNDRKPDPSCLTLYNVELLEEGKSHAYVNQAISAIQFYLRHVCGMFVSEKIPRPKKENKLPNELSLYHLFLRTSSWRSGSLAKDGYRSGEKDVAYPPRKREEGPVYASIGHCL